MDIVFASPDFFLTLSAHAHFSFLLTTTRRIAEWPVFERTRPFSIITSFVDEVCHPNQPYLPILALIWDSKNIKFFGKNDLPFYYIPGALGHQSSLFKIVQILHATLL